MCGVNLLRGPRAATFSAAAVGGLALLLQVIVLIVN